MFPKSFPFTIYLQKGVFIPKILNGILIGGACWVLVRLFHFEIVKGSGKKIKP